MLDILTLFSLILRNRKKKKEWNKKSRVLLGNYKESFPQVFKRNVSFWLGQSEGGGLVAGQRFAVGF